MTNQSDEKQLGCTGNRLRSRSVEERHNLRRRAFSQSKHLMQTLSFDQDKDKSLTHDSTSGSESRSSRVQTNRTTFRLSQTSQTKPLCLQSRQTDYSLTQKGIPTRRDSSHACVLPDITPPSRNSQLKSTREPKAVLKLERLSTIEHEEKQSAEKCRDWVSSLPEKFSGLNTVSTSPDLYNSMSSCSGNWNPEDY